MSKGKRRSLGSTIIIFLGLLNVAGIPKCPGLDKTAEENCEIQITEVNEGGDLGVGVMPLDPNQPFFAYSQIQPELHPGFEVQIEVTPTGSGTGTGLFFQSPGSTDSAGFSMYQDANEVSISAFGPQASYNTNYPPGWGVRLDVQHDGSQLDFYTNSLDPNAPATPQFLGSVPYSFEDYTLASFDASGDEGGSPIYFGSLEIYPGTPSMTPNDAGRIRNAVNSALAEKGSAWSALGTNPPDWDKAAGALKNAYSYMMTAMELSKPLAKEYRDPVTNKKSKELKKAYKLSKKGMKKVGSLLKKVGKKKKKEDKILKSLLKEIIREGQIRVYLEGY